MKLSKFLLIVGLMIGLLTSISSCYVARKDRGMPSAAYPGPKYKMVPPAQKSFHKKKYHFRKWKTGPIPRKKNR